MIVRLAVAFVSGLVTMATAQTPITPVPVAVAGGSLERSVFLRMSDGVRLATDIYFPPGERKGRSTIVLRTPYRKGGQGNITWAHFFAARGFVVVVQDVRGRWESEGLYSFYSHDRSDFAATASWIVSQDWSNRRIGTFGCSYLGEIQIIQAGGRNPHLKAMLPMASSGGTGSAGGRYRYFSGTMGGAYELAMAFSWFTETGSIVFARLDPDLPRASYLGWIDRFNQYPPKPVVSNVPALLRSLPLRGMFDRAGFPPTNFDLFISTPLGDSLWARRGFLSDTTAVDVPSLFVNGWYDYGVGETVAQYRFFRQRSLTERARRNQHLILGPGSHCGDVRAADADSFVIGERVLGDTRFPLREVYLEWFRHWLDRDGSGTLDLAPVNYYLMGKNEWRQASDFPVPGTQFTKFYLSAGRRGARSLDGDGALEARQPKARGTEATAYVYDPADPTPMLGGPACCDFENRAAGSYDQRPIEARPDVLVFTSAPLRSGVEVSGPVKMVLYVSSDAPDTDFVGKLIDVYPDGRAFLLQEGVLRARYREGFDRVRLMDAGQVYRVEVDLQATANYFAAGHRIRLDISSSHFPRFDRNLNTGGSQIDETTWRVANNKVHHSTGHPSYLLLPVVPEGASTSR